MKIFKFELTRFILNKRNKYLLTLISALIVFYAAYSTLSFISFFGQNQISVLSENTKSNKKEALDNINSLESVLKSSKLISEIDNTRNSISDMTKNVNLYQSQIDALSNKNVNEYYALQKELDKIQLAENTNQLNSEQENKRLNQEIKYIDTVQNRHLNFEVLPSPQSHAFGNFQQQFIPILSSSLFIVLFASMVSITIASGYEAKENQLYQFTGIDSRKTLLAKVCSGTLATFVWLLVSGLVYFIIIGSVNGFGNWNYPAYLANASLTTGYTITNLTIPNGIVDIGSLFYLFFVIFFLASLGALISVFVKRSMVVVGVIALLVLGYSMIENVGWIVPFHRYIPMSYFSPLTLFGNPSSLAGRYSLLVGATYLFILSGAFLFFAHLMLKNQKLRRI